MKVHVAVNPQGFQAKNFLMFIFHISGRTYVHRVGHTARVGKPGRWLSIYFLFIPIINSRLNQARYFKQMLKSQVFFKKVKMLKIGDEDLAPLTPHYEVKKT